MDANPARQLRTGRLVVLALIPLVAGFVMGCLNRKRKLPRSLGRCGARATSIERLCQSILGNSKQAVRRVFGPPAASAGFASIAPAMLVSSDSSHADIWYYPLDPTARSAMAVEFAQDIARSVQIVTLPEIAG